MTDILNEPLTQRALIIAFLVGLSAPAIGIYLVQKGMSLMGDGIGHISLTGVALGWLAGTAWNLEPHDTLAIPGAILLSILGAWTIEIIRSKGKTQGDVALAILFYGGIAGGIILISLAGGTTTNLMSYLFGSLSTVSVSDLWYTLILTIVIISITHILSGPFFSVSHDEEFAISSGLPITFLNITLATLTALTVSISMHVVGALLVSAIMIVPIATAQLLGNSFAKVRILSTTISIVSCLLGVIITSYYPLSPGATIVVLLIGIYALTAIVKSTITFLRKTFATDS
ncbi:MAG: metal ABC transporter permease [Actinomycetaceae bacterium]|nr:metal ABC transporter permease [Actinomycetaceae bacterium]